MRTPSSSRGCSSSEHASCTYRPPPSPTTRALPPRPFDSCFPESVAVASTSPLAPALPSCPTSLPSDDGVG
ncbi:uncharacterized protein SCHCODRAFT_02608779, partial [Schizophyllum commune H4-8]|uniref:uncharacterized protein n=1 Tax=Schizophyllum commune (strain H4-8 / FGSC 9210) TaxID=578458 RepID=UPI00215F4F1C